MSTISTKTSLDNGLTVIHQEMPWLSTVSFSIILPFGTAHENTGQEGSSVVLHDWIFRGAEGLSSREISDQLDNLGSRRGGGTGKELSRFSGSSLSKSFPETLEIFAKSLKNPNLTDDEFKSAKLLAEQELESLEDNPNQQLFVELSKQYFASSHSNSSYGSSAGLANLQAQELREIFDKYISPTDAILAVAGGIGQKELIKEAQKHFSDWKAKNTKTVPVKLKAKSQNHKILDSNQVQIGISYPAITPEQPGWYENALAVSVLSGGMSARLFSEVREKRALVYNVSVFSRVLKKHGYSMAYAGTSPEKADETLEVLTNELRKLSAGVNKDELERARIGLQSQLVMQAESSSAKASSLANDYYLLGRCRSPEEIITALNGIKLNDLNVFLEGYKPQFRIMSLGPNELKKVEL